jgi:hypothetical protein
VFGGRARASLAAVVVHAEALVHARRMLPSVARVALHYTPCPPHETTGCEQPHGAITPVDLYLCANAKLTERCSDGAGDPRSGRSVSWGVQKLED